VEYDGTRYAALVIYSGLKIEPGPPLFLPGQSRQSTPFDIADEKSIISNYLEQGRDLVFAINAGNGSYPIVAAGSNDVIMCIKDDMSVEKC
jgi:hypothetical protein